jgi:hypothetical protein
MNKPFLLIAGDHFYPEPGTHDWIDRFSSEDEAKEGICSISEKSCCMDGKYMIKGRAYDWYEIVNLETWGIKFD